MKTKDLLFEHYDTIKVLVLGFAICVLLLALRIRYTESFFFLFLGWNLILAMVPYGITFIAQTQPLLLARKWSFGIIFLVWLLFLPNSPYIVTDLVHLKLSSPHSIFYDIILILSYAITGFMFGIYSVLEMTRFLAFHFSERAVRIIIWGISFLCGFGVFIGRFLRFNSWDFITDPSTVFLEIAQNLQNPLAWLLTFYIGLLMLLVTLWLSTSRNAMS